MESRDFKTWYVYMLRCEGGSLYTGITTDVARRVREHLGIEPGGAKYTRSHRPREVAAAWEVPGHGEAAALEAAIKRLGTAGKRELVAKPCALGSLVEWQGTADPVSHARVRGFWPAEA